MNPCNFLDKSCGYYSTNLMVSVNLFNYYNNPDTSCGSNASGFIVSVNVFN